MEAKVILFGNYLQISLLSAQCENLDHQLGQLDDVQEKPQLVDPHVQGLIDPIVDHLVKKLPGGTLESFEHDLFRVIYHLCKLRGAKVIVKLLPNHVSLLEPVLNTLKIQSHAAPDTWYSRYVLLLWLSLIAMAPFDLKTFDQHGKSESRAGIVARILSLAEAFLGTSSREREAAGLLIARVITRKDVNVDYMPAYLARSLDVWSSETCTVHFRIGFLVSLCEIFRIGNRDVLQNHVLEAVDLLRQVVATEDFGSNTLLRKLRMKLSQRLALSMLKPTRASWRYKNDPKSFNLGAGVEATEEPEEPSEAVEEVIGVLLDGIQDRDNVVRYSAAKGVGRVTSRLPLDFAQEIVGAIQALMSEQTHIKDGVLTLNEDASDATWQGCCLAIAELCRHGALLPDALHLALPIVILALLFDLRKGSHSIGTIVRDAACYLLWSVLRCYTSQVLQPLAHQIATTLITIALFDREISVRRAASAAYQEGVGRHAQDLFPDGIAVLTLADFHSVGQRQRAFLQVAPEVFVKPAYSESILQYLIHVSLCHWDTDIRQLASRTLAELYLLKASLVLSKFDLLHKRRTSLDVNARHGAFYAVGELCRVAKSDVVSSFGEFGTGLPDYVLSSVTGGLIAHGFCHCVRYAVQPETTRSIKQEYFKYVLRFLSLADSSVRSEAGHALCSLLRKNDQLLCEFEAFAKRTLLSCTTPVAKGTIQAVGMLDYVDAEPVLERFVQLLLPLTTASGLVSQDDPETRQLAIIALGQVSEQWLPTGGGSGLILNTLSQCLQDYAVDARGDVGSWVRLGAMSAALRVFPVLQVTTSPADKEAVIHGILQQCLSKIDNVHATALNTLQELLPHLPDQFASIAQIMPAAILSLSEGSSAAVTPPLFAQLLHGDTLRTPVLREMCVLAGLSGHNRGQAARTAVTALFRHCEVEELIKLMDAIVNLAEEYATDDRVLISTLDMLATVFEYQAPERLLPGSYDFNKLFDVVQKSCLRSRHVAKVAASMRIYRGLVSLLPSDTDASRRAWKKLGLLLSHGVPRIRVLAAEQIFIVVNELNFSVTRNAINEDVMKALLRTEWTGPVDKTLAACELVRAFQLT